MSVRSGNYFDLLKSGGDPGTEAMLNLLLGDNAEEERSAALADPSSGSKRVSPSSSESATQSSDETKKYTMKNPMVWMDLEMTGLDPDTDHIIEVAVLITDGDLSVPYIEGPNLVIHQPEEVLQNMNEWCITNHEKTGLTKRCQESTLSLREAEDTVLEFLQQHTQSMEFRGPSEHRAHLAGNSVYVDRAFLQKHMPRVHAHLHWRLIDVSTVLELTRRWYPQEHRKAPKKKVKHTAQEDILESLAELRYYKEHVFKPPGKTYAEFKAEQAENERAHRARIERARISNERGQSDRRGPPHRIAEQSRTSSSKFRGGK